MGALSPGHWAIVAVVLLVLFGSKKLPDAARGLGRSLRILKSEVGELQTDDQPTEVGAPESAKRLSA
ncbi:Sec-independent protein translocase subunit TatA [Rhodococcus sp. AG1013]|uniref:Sec-independent protein translocase subunit TatA n=1 Tax=unclassified Rhodococcus (in: high G+C Gram-positive bacteria) TaxID=192944 RepID=UPI000E0C2CA9|nr:Sec-independent protein translocase subunit TatA [Rhodococcus sp. AG1013]RDI30615.1 sec-independent protein translocase protein TatA [Rhodococcus sp. AG1013]